MLRLAIPTRRVQAGWMLAAAIPFVALIGLVDYSTGPVAMSLLYYVPIVATAWLSGLWPSLLIAVASATSLHSVALLQAEHATAVIHWNSFTRGVTFLALATFVSLIRRDRDALDELNRKLAVALRNEEGLARTDTLTGIANGRAFRETLGRELARAQRDGRAIAVAYLDLDNFKKINDGFGHDEGDRVLRRVADALTESVRIVDLAARVGGDEFAIAISNPTDATCELVGSRILDKIAALAADYPGVGFGATVGFAIFETPPLEPETLLKSADDAMYALKSAGKGRFGVVRC